MAQTSGGQEIHRYRAGSLRPHDSGGESLGVVGFELSVEEFAEGVGFAWL